MVLRETKGGCGAIERSGDSEGSGAGTQRTENGTFLTAATEEIWESCQGLSRPSYSASEAGETERMVTDRKSPPQVSSGGGGNESLMAMCPQGDQAASDSLRDN